MTAQKTMGKKELIHAGDFLSLCKGVQFYVVENSRQLAVTGIIVLIIASGIGFWVAKQISAEKDAMSLLYNALNIMSKKSENIVDREINYNRALESLKTIRSRYSGTKPGVLSLFYAGVCCYNLKKYDEAISNYEKFLNIEESMLNYLRPSAFEGIGYCYKEKGDFTKALDYFQKQKSEEKAGGNTMALLNLARCYEAMGNIEKACQFYKDFNETDSSPTFKEVAQIKISDLCIEKKS